ncbi:MAG TPA: MurR/RpiR family transcriptional regulator [Chloroflexia bacterium]|nr:MurR/RpiR family transcriptional regulator [Chloroflexia bacterium]
MTVESSDQTQEEVATESIADSVATVILNEDGRINLTSCLARVESALLHNNLFPAERKIAEYILQNPGQTIRFSVQELSDASRASRASIVRFCRTLGYSGYKDFKLALAAQIHGSVPIERQDVEMGDDIMSITRKVFQSDLQAIADSLEILDPAEVERAVEAFDKATRIEFYGVGSSASTALDAYYRFLRLGLPVNIVSDPYMQAIVSAQLGPGQVAFAISHSGRTEEVIFALQKAKEMGATTICLTSNTRGEVIQYADIKLITAARETAFRSQAMASRIAHLSVVDALYVNLAMRHYNEAAEKVHKSDSVVEEKRRRFNH